MRLPGLIRWWERRHSLIAVLAVLGIIGYGIARVGFGQSEIVAQWALWLVLGVGGGPLVIELAIRLFKREFGSDLLAGISIVTAIVLGEYLAAAIVSLMLAGGNALEELAGERAQRELRLLVERAPRRAWRRLDHEVEEVAVEALAPGDVVVVRAGEVVPADGEVAGDAEAVIDESALEVAAINEEPPSAFSQGRALC